MNIYDKMAVGAAAETVRNSVRAKEHIETIREKLKLGHAGSDLDIKLGHDAFWLTVEGKRVRLEYK